MAQQIILSMSKMGRCAIIVKNNGIHVIAMFSEPIAAKERQKCVSKSEDQNRICYTYEAFTQNHRTSLFF